MTEIVADKEKIFYWLVSRAIGGEVNPDRVRKMVDVLNASQHLVHGIKNERSIPGVRREGVLPLAPEGRGRGASFWTTGIRVFGDLSSGEGLLGFDSSFFHYGHASTSGKSDDVVMALAITNRALLEEKLGLTIRRRNDSQIGIGEAVPPEAMAFLIARAGRDKSLGARGMSQKVEQKMFSLLEETLREGYNGGEYRVLLCDKIAI